VCARRCCARVKEFLHKQNVTFIDRDVSTDPGAMEELERRGVMTTPVTVADGETVVGYDVEKLRKVLEL